MGGRFDSSTSWRGQNPSSSYQSRYYESDERPLETLSGANRKGAMTEEEKVFGVARGNQVTRDGNGNTGTLLLVPHRPHLWMCNLRRRLKRKCFRWWMRALWRCPCPQVPQVMKLR